MEIVLVIWLLCGIGAGVAANNGGANGCGWFALGVILGPLGFALALTNGMKCPWCDSQISTNATVCPRCHHSLGESAEGVRELPDGSVVRGGIVVREGGSNLPKTLSKGDTKDQVVAAFGQPERIAKLDDKEIYFYKDSKVTLINGKVDDAQ